MQSSSNNSIGLKARWRHITSKNDFIYQPPNLISYDKRFKRLMRAAWILIVKTSREGINPNINPDNINNSFPKSLNIDITEYLQPGLYAIINEKAKRAYIGHSNITLKRFPSHIVTLNMETPKHTALFNQDWKKYGRNGFTFLILEIGPEWDDKRKRQEREQLYMNYYLHKKKYELYNNLLSLSQGVKHSLMEDAKNLKPKDIDISYLCCQPGIYVIQNKKTETKYTGQAKFLASRLYDHIEWFGENKRITKKTSFFQRELKSDGIKGFYFWIYHYGPIFQDYYYRKNIELEYIHRYIDNCYNSFIEVDGKLESMNKKTRDMPVYHKDERIKTMKEAIKIHKFSHDRELRFILDNPKDNTFCYSRSFGRNSFTKKVKLIVFNREKIFFNESLASVETNVYSKTIQRRCSGETRSQKKGKEYKFLIDLSYNEKLKIPQLVTQVIREARLTIDIPLDINNSIDAEILQNQSPTYTNSPDNELTINDINQEDLIESFYLLKNRVIFLAGIQVEKNKKLLPEEISLGEEIAAEMSSYYGQSWLGESELDNELEF